MSIQTIPNDIANIYLDYANNYLSMDSFAAAYGITKQEAEKLIEIGRVCQERRAQTGNASIWG